MEYFDEFDQPSPNVLNAVSDKCSALDFSADLTASATKRHYDK